MNSKATNFRTPNAIHLHKPFFSVFKHQTFLQTKNFPFEQAFPCYSQKPAFFAPKAFLFEQTFPYYHPKQPFSTTNATHSHPAITYCPQKSTAVLFISALNPHAVTQEPRTDSKPFRRHFVRKTGFGSCCRKASPKLSPTEL